MIKVSKYNKTILTNDGLDLAIKAARGKAKFTITKTAASADNLADKKIEELQELTELPNIVQYGQIVDVADSTQDKNVVIGVGLYFNNQDLTQSYDLNTIALYAKEEGSDKEILYALTTAVEPETMPDYQDEVLFKFNLTMYVVVGQTDNVTVKVVEDGVVTDKKLEEKLQALPSKDDLTILRKLINDDIRDLAALNAADGNNIYNTTINLDAFSTVGISKFLGCQLKSDGKMVGFDSTQGNLYGWIFNVPKWNGAKTYEQIVYISDYGQGSLSYVRTKADATSKEDFIKVANDKDLTAFAQDIKKQIENAGQVKTVDGIAPDEDGNVETGRYTNAEIDQRVTDINSNIAALDQITMKTWIGTLEQYQSLPKHDSDTIYYVISSYAVVVK